MRRGESVRFLKDNIQPEMDDANRDTKNDNTEKNIPTERSPGIGPDGQQTNASHAHDDGNHTQNQHSISEWFRHKFTGHRPLEWLTFAFEVLTFFALCIYSYFSYGQWQAMKDQKIVMQGQLEQMKGTSTQTDRLIGETHTLATNAGVQAANAADQVKKLSALVDATNKQAVATRGQLSVMQGQVETTDRPWINVTIDIDDGLHFDQTGRAIFKLRYTLQNTGRSTAIGITSSLVVKTLASMIVDWDWKKPMEEQAVNCADRANDNGDYGDILFPGQITTRSPWSGVTPKVASRSTYPGAPDEALKVAANEYRIVIFGCVDYRYTASVRHHQTGFAYEVRFMRGPNNYGDLTIGTDVPQESLKLERFGLGGFFAN